MLCLVSGKNSCLRCLHSYLNLALNREVEGLVPCRVLAVLDSLGAEMLH